MAIRKFSFAILGLPLLVACGPDSSESEEPAGVVDLALTAPAGVGSVSIQFQGVRRNVTRCVRIDQAPVTRLSNLPTGEVQVTAAAFADETCGGTATWLAEPLLAQLQPGAPTGIALVMRPNGIVDVSTNFVSDAFADDVAPPQDCTLLYDARLGTLPEAQGFPYFPGTENPQPTVADGVLAVESTNGQQYWRVAAPELDFSASPSLEARLLVETSNHVPDIGGGTREGYYLELCMTNSCNAIGLAGDGFNVNTASAPGQAITPYAVAGVFHTYRAQTSAAGVTLSIDGVPVSMAVPPELASVLPSVSFGPSAGASRSSSKLAWLCYRANG